MTFNQRVILVTLKTLNNYMATRYPQNKDDNMSNFKTIEKLTNQMNALPDNTVRVRPNGLSISANVVERLAKYTHKTRLGKSFNVSIQISPKQHKIRLVPCKDGFSVYITPSGVGSVTGLPSKMRKEGMPQGDYYSGNNLNTFVLVQ